MEIGIAQRSFLPSEIQEGVARLDLSHQALGYSPSLLEEPYVLGGSWLRFLHPTTQPLDLGLPGKDQVPVSLWAENRRHPAFHPSNPFVERGKGAKDHRPARTISAFEHAEHVPALTLKEMIEGQTRICRFRSSQVIEPAKLTKLTHQGPGMGSRPSHGEGMGRLAGYAESEAAGGISIYLGACHGSSVCTLKNSRGQGLGRAGPPALESGTSGSSKGLLSANTPVRLQAPRT